METNNTQPTIILVLGMHRSGTSLVAQMIAQWGAYMGEKLCDADFNNEDGYWEFEKLNTLNERILHFLNTSWMLPPKNIDIELLISKFGEEAKSLIDEMDRSGHKIWCWKDPRMAILFNFWRKIFDNRKIIKVFSFRHPLSVTKSLQKRDNLPSSFSLLLWEQYTQNIFDIIGNDECCFMEYEKILSAPGETGRKLFHFLNQATGIIRNNNVCENMVNSVKPQLNHSINTDPIIDNSHIASLYLSLKKEEKPSKIQLLNQADNWYKNELSNLFREKLSLENNIQHFAQLFIETTKASYNEKDSIKKLVNTEVHSLDFDVSGYKDILSLRIDPLNDWCEIEIYGFRILKDEKILFQPDNFFTNASFNSGSYYLFNNNDPQIYIVLTELSAIDFDKVEIDITYKSMGNATKLIYAERMSKDLYQQTENDRINVEYLAQLEKHSLADEEKIKNVLLQMERIEEQIVAKEKIIKDLSALLYEKDQLMFNKNEHITKLEDVITRKSNLIFQLQSSLADHTRQATVMETTIDELKASVQRLTIEKKELQKIITEKQTTNDQYLEKIINYKQNIDQLEESITTLNNRLEHKDNKIKTIQQNLIALHHEINDKHEIQKKLQLNINQINDSKKRIENELTVIKSSRTYNVVRIASLILNPVAILHSLKKHIRNNKNAKKIAECHLFDVIFYLHTNPDVAKSRMNPAKHYLLHGGFEGRNPSEKFNSELYWQLNPDVKEAGMNPLLHYILYGEKEGRKISTEIKDILLSPFPEIIPTENSNNPNIPSSEDPEIAKIRESGLFDENFYYEQYSDIRNAGIDGLKHYHQYGWKEGRNPSNIFDTVFYLETNSDVKKLGINPLLHYVLYGQQENRPTQFRIDIIDIKKDEYEEAHPINIALDELPAKILAFYLPQFHPFKENNEWWGEGFTEWTNTAKAQPQYEGHYQPHLPGAMGFYDLRLPDILAQQAQMAKQFGIYGFCFHHYYFAGKRLMEVPVDNLLAHPEIDLPFCLCWANENWTRRWDGMEDDILIAQDHSPEDDIRFLNDIEKYFLDPRYIRVENKPFFIIYKANQFPDLKSTIQRWRNHWRQKWGEELHIVMAMTFGETDPTVYGFDAAVEFPPHNIGALNMTEKEKTVDGFDGNIFSYEDFMTKSLIPREINFKLYKTAFPGWDNTARRDKKASIYAGGSTSLYQYWLTECIKHAQNKLAPSHRFVFINAWNEWAEGCHLEPDQKYGYAYLNATQRAIYKNMNHQRDSINSGSILFVSHDAFKAGAQLVLLETIKWLSMQTAIKLKVIFLKSGELINEFSLYAKTHILSDIQKEDVFSEVNNFLDGDENVFYLNSVASGSIIKTLKKFKKPILLHLHELQKSIDIYAPNCINDIIDYTDHFIACSNAVYENMLNNYKIDKNKISLIHAYVDSKIENKINNTEKRELKRKLDLPIDKKIIIGMGRGLFWRKGVDLFIDICQIIKKKNYQNSCQFIWVGDCFEDGGKVKYGTWDNQLVKIKKLGLNDDMRFIGYVSNVHDYLQAADIFLLPSREDPFPLVCLEAADCYLPIICFDEAGGMPEFVQNDAGFVVPYLDTKEMAAKTLYLLSNDNERNKKGETAHYRLVNNFSVNISVCKIHDVIKTIGNINPLVSIIVPNYNYARYLHQRLESIYNQTFQNFEVIILDDCSTDDSMEVISTFKHKPSTKVIKNEENSGSVFKQWEKGVELAKGKFIWIAEADDFSDSTFLDTMLPSFANEKVTLAYCNSNAVNEKGEITSDFYLRCNYYEGLGYNASKWSSDYINEGIDEIKNVLAIKNTIPNCSAVVFRKEIFLEMEKEHIEKMSCSHDWLTYINLIKEGNIAYISKALNYHRRHSNSVIAKNAKNYYHTLNEYFITHFYIIKNFNIDTSIRQKIISNVHNNLFPIWTESSDFEKNKAYPITLESINIFQNRYKYKKEGYCPICAHRTFFYSDSDWFRDNYRCSLCNSIPRERAIFNFLDNYHPNWKEKKIHESSPSNRYFEKNVKEYSFSQYFPDKRLGTLINNTRNENLENLTFEDSSFDFFISLDVLEHVFNPDIAIKEMLRTVKKQGSVVFTVPIHKNLQFSFQRAKRNEDGTINYIHKEEYHGNPVGNGKSLVTWNYGKDFKDLIQNWIGQSDFNITIKNLPQAEFGIEGEFLDVIEILKL